MTVNPCPFCGSEDHEIRPNQMWTGKRYRVYSVELHHWCYSNELPQTFIKITGRTEQETIDSWNKRVE